MQKTIHNPDSRASLQRATWQGLQSLAPPPTLKVSEWADRNRYLPKGSSARPGPWITESFQAEMMDAILEPEVREVVYMTCTQVVKSEALNNIIGYFIDAEPKPIMMVQPTDRTAIAYSKKRIAPMIASSPALHSKVRIATTRQAGNTTLLKEFDGGFLKIAGANSGAGLRTDPIEVLVFDEIDAYPDDVDGEGDPIEIATRRTDSFMRALIAKASTPAKPRGLSKIEGAYEASDRRRYHVPCPFCKRLQILAWRDEAGAFHLVWEEDGSGAICPDTVRYLCRHCGQGIEERHKFAMLRGGQWIPERPWIKDIVGFHLNALYSPWKMNWLDLAKEWKAAQNNPEKLRSFINLRLAETWDEGALAVIGAPALAERREKWPEGKLPENVAVLVASADVQNTRIEAQVMGFGPGEECWLIDRGRFEGNPGLAEDSEASSSVWEELDRFLVNSWTHASGIELSPALCLVDAGAHTDAVYNFVLPRQHAGRRVFACKGQDHLSRIGLVAEGVAKRAKIRLFTVGTYAAKDRIFARLKVKKPGPAYFHIPDWAGDDYLEQLTAEIKVPIINRRTRVVRYEYRKIQERNEALDLTVYCHAALAVLQQFIAPAIYKDLDAVLAALVRGQHPDLLIARRVRRMRSAGIDPLPAA